tara:strand:+ start:224 stop:556 length:333 start_codon:yes stop_codon:yes gene_type:complete
VSQKHVENIFDCYIVCSVTRKHDESGRHKDDLGQAQEEQHGLMSKPLHGLSGKAQQEQPIWKWEKGKGPTQDECPFWMNGTGMARRLPDEVALLRAPGTGHTQDELLKRN